MIFHFNKTSGLNFDQYNPIVSYLRDCERSEYEVIIKKKVKTRTIPQNNSIHVYCGDVAENLNNAGITKFALLSLLRCELPWSMDSVKEDIWRNFQVYKGFPKSTTQLSTAQVTQVYDLCNRFISEKFKMHIPFPSQEDIMIHTLLSNN